MQKARNANCYSPKQVPTGVVPQSQPLEGGSASNCSGQMQALALAVPRRNHKRAVTCQIRDCCVNLTELGKLYCIRKRICPTHLTADAVLLEQTIFGDQKYRFCHQCGKLEPASAFDGTKRSCRSRLLRRRVGQKQERGKGRKRSADIFENEDSDDDYEPHHHNARVAKRAATTKSDVTQFKHSEVEVQKQQQLLLGSAAVESSVRSAVQGLALTASIPQQSAPGAAAAVGTRVATPQHQLLSEPASSTTESRSQQHHMLAPADSHAGDHTLPASAAVSPDCCMSSDPTVRDQDFAPQLQQQQQWEPHLTRSCAPQAETCADPMWDDLLAAFADGAMSADDGVDVQLLRQLELELAEEQQQQRSRHTKIKQLQQLQGPVSNTTAMTSISRAPGDTMQPAATAAAAKVAAALVNNIGLMLEPQSSVTQPSGDKMELVNKVLEAWYEDTMITVDVPDNTGAHHLQLCGHTTGSNQPSPAAVGSHQQQCLAMIARPASAVPNRQCGHAADFPVAATSDGSMRPVSHHHHHQQQTAVGAGQSMFPPYAASNAASSMISAACNTSAATPMSATAPQTAAVERLMQLQRKVHEMSSQLAQLQGVMVQSVEELVMMGPPAHIPPAVIHQLPTGLTHQQSLSSSATTAAQLQVLSRQQQQQVWGAAAARMCRF